MPSARRYSPNVRRRSSTGPNEDGAPEFDWAVVPCASREEAEREAERQQQIERGNAVWIYVRVNGEWVAKRTPADPTGQRDPHPSRGWRRGKIVDSVVDAVFDPDTWTRS